MKSLYVWCAKCKAVKQQLTRRGDKVRVCYGCGAATRSPADKKVPNIFGAEGRGF